MFKSRSIRVSVSARKLKKKSSILIVSDQQPDGKFKEESRSPVVKGRDPFFPNTTDLWSRQQDRLIQFQLVHEGKIFSSLTVYLSSLFDAPNRRWERLLDNKHGVRLPDSKLIIGWVPGPEPERPSVPMAYIPNNISVQVAQSPGFVSCASQANQFPMMQPGAPMMFNPMIPGMMRAPSFLPPPMSAQASPPAYSEASPPGYSEVGPPSYEEVAVVPESTPVLCSQCRIPCRVPVGISQFVCPTCGAAMCLPPPQMGQMQRFMPMQPMQVQAPRQPRPDLEG